MFMPVFALNKGSSLYQEDDFETHFRAARPRIDLCTKNPPGFLHTISIELHVKLSKIISNIIAGNKIPTGNGYKLENALQLGLVYSSLTFAIIVSPNIVYMRDFVL